MSDIDKKKEKVAVGMSGGVDSSVAALLLKEQDYDVTGVYMQCWDVKDDGCAADEDKAYALQTAMRLEIPFKTLDLREDYKKRVIDYFYSEYESGRTPNPDVMCNKEIKFGIFFDWATAQGFDFISTGHYAGINYRDGKYHLMQGKDEGKDQSYFLHRLGQEQLNRTLFPLALLEKKEIRQLAEKHSLPAAKRPESMGICFIGEVDIKDFLSKRIKNKPGRVINSKGEVIGDHDGVWYFTIGQRHGFKVQKYSGEPLYVIGKNVVNNTLTVGSYEEALSEQFEVDDLNWVPVNPFESTDNIQCEVRIRHLGNLIPAKVRKMSEQKLEVILNSKVFGVAPGQSAVFYLNTEVLGGGIIC